MLALLTIGHTNQDHDAGNAVLDPKCQAQWPRPKAVTSLIRHHPINFSFRKTQIQIMRRQSVDISGGSAARFVEKL